MPQVTFDARGGSCHTYPYVYTVITIIIIKIIIIIIIIIIAYQLKARNSFLCFLQTLPYSPRKKMGKVQHTISYESSEDED